MRSTARLIALILIAITANLALQPPAVADSIRDRQWHLRYLDVDEAHRLSRGEGVIVGVIDSGVDANHPDLLDAVLPGVSLITPGGDGRRDFDGHGTAMAGLIAGRGHGPESSGVLGIAPRSMILPVDTGSRGETGIAKNVASGIEWAVQHGARVICLALGSEIESRYYEPAIQRALAADAVVIASAGNKPRFNTVAYPAAYSGVVAVSGTDQLGNHADISVAGSEIALAAPAVEIQSTDVGGTYRRGSGTSDAAAITAGVAALVRAKFPKLRASEVVHRLTSTASDKGPPGRDLEYGYGIVNPVAALTAENPLLTTATATESYQSRSRGYKPMATIVVALTIAAGATGALLLLCHGKRRRR